MKLPNGMTWYVRVCARAILAITSTDIRSYESKCMFLESECECVHDVCVHACIRVHVYVFRQRICESMSVHVHVHVHVHVYVSDGEPGKTVFKKRQGAFQRPTEGITCVCASLLSDSEFEFMCI